MKTLIIDDEKPSRDALRHYVEKYCPEIKVVGEADSVKSGLAAIERCAPALIFLDIEMPYGNGFDLLDQLPEGDTPEVVFVTAYEQYALRALRQSAAHYLLKPVDIDDLIEAVGRVRERIGLRQQGEVNKTLLNNLRDNKKDVPTRLALPLIDGLEIVAPGDIRYCEAADNFTQFHLVDGRKLLICRKLKYYTELLEPAGFCRIHRSSVVNLARVKRYQRGKGGAVVLDDGTELTVAVARKNELLAKLAG